MWEARDAYAFEIIQRGLANHLHYIREAGTSREALVGEGLAIQTSGEELHRILRTSGQNFRGNNSRWRLERISSERHQGAA
jgi:hypothetical protein